LERATPAPAAYPGARGSRGARFAVWATMSDSSDSEEDERAKARERHMRAKKAAIAAEVNWVKDEDDADERRMEQELTGQLQQEETRLRAAAMQARILVKLKGRAGLIKARTRARAQAAAQPGGAADEAPEAGEPSSGDASRLPSIQAPSRVPSGASQDARAPETVRTPRLASAGTAARTGAPPAPDAAGSAAALAPVAEHSGAASVRPAAAGAGGQAAPLPAKPPSSPGSPPKEGQKARSLSLSLTAEERRELEAKEQKRLAAAAADDECRKREAEELARLKRETEDKERELQERARAAVEKAEAEARARRKFEDAKAAEIRRQLEEQEQERQRAGAESAAKRAELEVTLGAQRAEQVSRYGPSAAAYASPALSGTQKRKNVTARACGTGTLHAPSAACRVILRDFANCKNRRANCWQREPRLKRRRSEQRASARRRVSQTSTSGRPKKLLACKPNRSSCAYRSWRPKQPGRKIEHPEADRRR